MEYFTEKTKHIEQKFIKLLRAAFNFKDALKRQNIEQDDIERLRAKVRGSKFVPKFIVDKQVKKCLNSNLHFIKPFKIL